MSTLIVRANTAGDEIYSSIEENNEFLTPRVSSTEVHASMAHTDDPREKLIKIVRNRKTRERGAKKIFMKMRN